MTTPIPITHKRYQVWSLLCEGMTPLLIARTLGIPAGAVNDRLRELKRQVGANSLVELLTVEFAPIISAPLDLPPLTRREGQVARLVAAGKLHRIIGVELGISAETVKSHLQNIYDKLGLSNKIEVTLWVLEQSKKDKR